MDPQVDNPFLRDRLKTFQPFDLWEWLLKLAIVLFPLDVGIRRIQLDREEWLRATAGLRRWLFFWKGRPRPVEADESLAALLARRDEVRSKQPVLVETPRAELFKPENPVSMLGAGGHGTEEKGPGAAPLLGGELEKKAGDKREEPVSTTSRLLEAKRRARKNRE